MPGRIAPGCLRLGSLNPNCLSNDSKNTKDDDLFTTIQQYGLDATLLQELGQNWSRQPRHWQWKTRAARYLEEAQTRSYMSHNERDKTGTPFQWGGTGIMAYGKLAHFSMGAGNDKKRLGRWTWTRYRGKDGMVLRLISIYRPVEHSNDNQKGVGRQHKRYLQSINDDRHPRKAWIEDFEEELQEWLLSGDNIVVAGDINTYIFDDEIVNLFDRNGLTNLIFDRHSKEGAPKTCTKSTRNRTTNGISTGLIIDSMWGTTNLVVKACGYLEPGDGPGDHSLVWADITYDSALGHRPPNPQVPQARRLNLSNSKCVKKYLDHYEQELAGSNIEWRQHRLSRTVSYGTPPTPSQAKEANAIDDQRTVFMKRAEKKCRKIKHGHVAFSLATENPKRKIAFWIIAIRRRSGKRVSAQLWRRKKKKAKITTSTRHMTVDDMIAEIKKEKNNYRDAKKQHKKERETFLDTLAPKDRDRLKQTEKARELGRAAKRTTGKLQSKSVTKVIVDGTECNTKPAMEQALHKINYAKIRASDDTPFMQPPLVHEFGYRNNTDATNNVLTGAYTTPHNTDPYAKILLHELAIPTEPPKYPHNTRLYISTDDHIKGWSKAKERTSSGMSGLHFGMFKANIKRRHLATLDAAIRSFAYTTGFTYNRWKRGLDVQLLKRSQDFRAEKLRTILLLEADFNMNNKVLGNDAMKLGEASNALHRDNYGGRKGMCSNEVGLNSTLTHNSIFGRRGRAVIMSNDAKGCYDRIAHTVAQLALQRLGIPKPAMQSMIDTIQEMTHYIRTAFGDSDTSYGKTPWEPPPQGILQGNGAGPATWSAISSIIITAMKKAGFGYNDWSLIRKRSIEITSFAFVDDTDLIHINNKPNISTQNLIAEAQQALTTWEGLIRATGGDLAPEKSYWYMLEVKRKDGKWKYLSKQDTQGDLYLKNGTYCVKRHEVTVAQEALGIQSRPDGQMADEIKYLKGKITKWCDAIRTNKVYKTEAWYVFNCTIMKTIEYPLIATTFTKKQLKNLMSPLLRTVLPLAGVQRNLPRKLVYGTLRSRGLDIRDPYLTQLIHHLQAVLRHHHRNTPTRDLLDDNIDITQTHVGSQIPFWELPYQLYGFLAPKGWIKQTWKALSDTPLTIRGVDITIPTERPNDQHLMDVFVGCGRYNQDELMHLQDCRLFLEVTTLSHICQADGHTIDDAAWNGRILKHRRKQPWVNTYKPGINKWDLWRQALRDNFLFPHVNHKRLRQPLGPWHNQHDTQWKWWTNSTQTILWEHTNNEQWTQWTYHPTQRGNNRRFYQPLNIPHKPLVPDLHRAQVTHHPRSAYAYLSNKGAYTNSGPTTTPTTLYQQLQTLPHSAHWALSNIIKMDNGQTIATNIQNNTAVAVSDGSLKLGYGTSAYVIEGTNHLNRIIGVNTVPGPIKDGDSHRCELAGLYAIALIIDGITTLYNITSGSIQIACDNIQAIEVFEPSFHPNPTEQNFDLVNALWRLIQTSPIQWKHEHVKGHQDNKPLHRPLTRLEKLNVSMDHLAKHFWQHCCVHNNENTIPEPLHRHIYNEGWQIWCGERKIPHPSINNLYGEIQDPITQLWWVRHKYIPAQAMDSIDWNASEDLMLHIDKCKRRWVTKHASDNCGTGETLKLWKYTDTAKCPRCNELETTEHVYRCTGYATSSPWNQSIDTLKESLSKTDTDPDLATTLIDILQRWHNKQPISLTSYPTALHQLVRQQHKLGWKNLLEGLPVKAWRQHQNKYYKTNNIRKSSRRWLRGLLQQLHYLAWKQWDHRNDIKHRVDKPAHRAAVRMLNHEITREFLKGTTNLLPGDRHLMQRNRLSLLMKPLDTKKSWYANVIEARRRCENADAISKEASALYQWMTTRKPVD